MIYRKKILLLIIVLVIAGIAGCAGLSKVSETEQKLRTKTWRAEDIVFSQEVRTLPEKETLLYKVNLVGVPVGYLSASVLGKMTLRGKEVYKLEMKAWTNKFFSAVFKVNDRYVSYVDTENFRTLQFEEYRQEGKYRRDAITTFDHEKKMGRFEHLLNGSVEEFAIPDGVQDLLSAVYFFRTLPMELGQRVDFKVSADGDVYDLYGIVDSKHYVNLPKIGRVSSFYFQPYLMLEGEEVKKGTMGGFSTDSGRYPIRAVIKAPKFQIARATITLYKIEN